MMPVIRAEGSLRRAQEIAMGTGSLKRADSERIFRAWQRQAQVHETEVPRIAQKIDPVRDRSLLEAVGIKTRIIGREKDGDTE